MFPVNWRVDSITHSDVLVSPSGGRGAMAPFWQAEAQDRSFHLAERCGHLLAQMEARLADEEPEAPASRENDPDGGSQSSRIPPGMMPEPG